MAEALGLMFVGLLCFSAWVNVENKEAERKKRRLGRGIGRRQRILREAGATRIEPQVESTPKAIAQPKPASVKMSSAKASVKSSQMERDVVSALVNMGYKKRDAAGVVRKAEAQLQGCDKFETLLKTALQIKV